MRARQTRFSKALRRLWQDRNGAAILEFALVLPPLCLILLGMFEVAMLMFAQAAMEGGLREAARYGVTGQKSATPADRIAQIMALIDKHTYGLFDMKDAKVTYQVYPSFHDIGNAEPLTKDVNGNGKYDPPNDEYTDLDGDGCWDSGKGTDGAGNSSDVVRYTVSYDYPLMTPIIANVMGDAQGKVHLSASIVVRNEPWSSVTTTPTPCTP
jgi:Flp pilus assembly pilin Flp